MSANCANVLVHKSASLQFKNYNSILPNYISNFDMNIIKYFHGSLMPTNHSFNKGG